MQCTTVEQSSNRLWVRLVGHNHDLAFWVSGDPRPWLTDHERVR